MCSARPSQPLPHFREADFWYVVSLSEVTSRDFLCNRLGLVFRSPRRICWPVTLSLGTLVLFRKHKLNRAIHRRSFYVYDTNDVTSIEGRFSAMEDFFSIVAIRMHCSSFLPNYHHDKDKMA